MRKITLLFFVMISILISCSKVQESIVDCAGQSIFIDINHTVATGRVVTFNVQYSGTSHQLDNTVKWDFGDGTPVQTVSGSTVTHTFGAAGHYSVKANVSLTSGCKFEPHEPITLE